MKIYRVKDYDALSRKAADILAAHITLKPNCVLGLATGSTPLGTYAGLVEKNKNGALDFSQVTTVNLDEYRGLSPDNDQSYRFFMNKNLFSQVNIKPENSYLPDGQAADPAAECRHYEELIQKLGGVDVQLLGIGHNGHIGFNEPADSFQKDTYCVGLTESTIQANKRFFAREEDVPREAYTMGIGTIMKAKSILMLISGREKAQILKDAFAGGITPNVPASILQLHPDVTLVADEDALSLL